MNVLERLQRRRRGRGRRRGGAGATQERVVYLRKVYGLLSASVLIAGIAGYLAVSVGPTTVVHGRT